MQWKRGRCQSIEFEKTFRTIIYNYTHPVDRELDLTLNLL